MYRLGQWVCAILEPSNEVLIFIYTVENVAWAMGKHFAAAYIFYSISERTRMREPTAAAVAAAFLGSVGPDLIDKPLTWVGVLGYGRSFAHSLFTTTALLAVAFVLASHYSRADLSFAFAVGYLSHIFVDMFGEIFGSQPYIDTAFLFWPIAVKQPIVDARPTLPVTQTTIFTGIMICAVVLWILDGMTGVSDAVRAARDLVGGR